MSGPIRQLLGRARAGLATWLPLLVLIPAPAAAHPHVFVD